MSGVEMEAKGQRPEAKAGCRSRQMDAAFFGTDDARVSLADRAGNPCAVRISTRESR